MVRTFYWNGSGRGTFVVKFPFGTSIINRHSRVVCSVCELTKPPGEALDYPFVGDAAMSVLNVAPDDTGTVNVRLAVNWSSTLSWRVTFHIET